MKRILTLLTALILSFSCYSKGFKQPDFYIQRELKASPVLKTRLSQLRQEIASKNLQYTVGYTSVAEVPIEKITGARQLTPNNIGVQSVWINASNEPLIQ